MAAITVGELAAILTLKDLLSPALKDAEKAVDGFAGKWSGSVKAVGEAGALAVGAVTGIGAAIIALGSRGADVADVQAQFAVLNKSIGNTGDVLGTLRGAFDGTVSDFDIMQSVNKGLSQGLVLTESQMKLTAETARVLADRTGGDARTAFDALNMVMATGQDRALKTIGLNIDGTAAVERYAASIGKESSELTEAQQIEAKRAATLQAMADVLKVSGLAETDFADRVAQAKVIVANFTDSLGVAIAQNPQLEAGLTVVANAIQQAFGADKGEMVSTLSGLVGKFAIMLTYVAQGGIESGRLLGNVWFALNAIFNGVLATLAQAGASVVSVLASVVEMQAKLGLASQSSAKDARELADGMQAFADHSQEAVEQAIKDQDAFNAKMDTASGVVDKVRGAMEQAATATTKSADAVVKHKTNLDAALPTAEQMKKAMEGLAKSMGMFFDEVAHRREARENLFGMLGPSVSDANIEMARLVDVTQRLGGVTDLSDAQLITLVDSMRKQAAIGGESEEGFKLLAAAMEEAANRGKHVQEAVGFVTEGTQKATPHVKTLAERMAELGTVFGKVAGVVDAFSSLLDQLGVSADHGIGQAVKGLGDLAKAGQAAASSVASFASGDILGGITSGLSALGGVVSGVKNIWNGLFGHSEVMKVNDMRDAFFAAHGGFQAFGQEMAKVSSEDWAAKIFKAKTVEEFNALVKEAQGLLDTQGQAQEALNAAVEKYGFTVDELGPKWAQQELDKKAGELLKDYELLVASGIDVNTVIEKMGPNLNEYVNTAIKAGQSIPENMRPIIEKMIEQGQLLDENGNAFTSVEDAGISFTKSLSEGLSEVVESIKALVAALTGIPQSVSPIHVPVVYDDPGYDGRHGGGEEHAAAAGFSGWVMGPTRFLAGERGPEHVQITPAGKAPANGGPDIAQALQQLAMQQQQLPYQLQKALTSALQKARA